VIPMKTPIFNAAAIKKTVSIEDSYIWSSQR